MNNWITNLTKKNPNLTLNNLILPGTHNSACDKLTLDCGYNFPIISHVIKNWTLNQKWSVYEQLVNGVRMLDIDVSYIDNKFYTSHTFIIDELEDLIEQLKNYNEEYGDIYIIKFICRDNINNENVSELANIINNIFNTKIILPQNYPNVLNTPLSTFINSQQNMLIYMDCQNHSFFNTKIHLYSSWTNDNDISNSLYSNNLVLNQMSGLKTINSNVLMDLNWTLTPTYKEIIYGTFCCCDFYDIRSWTKLFNILFFDFYNNNKIKFTNINVVSFDFINKDLISQIINLN